MYLVFNVAVLPFRVLSDNHKIHIFMSKNNKKKNVCWSVNDTKPKASIYSHYHYPHHLINAAACLAQLGEHLSAEWKHLPPGDVAQVQILKIKYYWFIIIPGYITNQFNEQLPVFLLAQLVRVQHWFHRGQGSNTGRLEFF